jgi:ATP-dependent DNA helicase RecG
MQMTISDETGRLKLSRFYAGHRYSTKWQYAQKAKYPKGAIIAASGIVKGNSYGLTLDAPELELLDDAYGEIESMQIGRLLPVYPLTEGVGADLVRRTIAAVLPSVAQVRDPLPVALRQTCDLIDLPIALTQIHFPSDRETLSRARKRLVFDEFFYLQLGLLKRRQELRRGQPDAVMARSAVLETRGELIERFYELLPFRMTGAQQRVIDEILADLTKPSPMNRLVQGDVGAGKTVVAVVAILAAIQSGYQAALMAPTEVLVEQHYRKLADWLTQLNLPVELLTGSVGSRKRRQIYSQLATGELPVLVGTHALIQDKVVFHRLGLSVIDEQHRFGVQQRAMLQSKGENGVCHVLSMTATPIPRTLALTLHGDLDVSQIDELPPGRKPIQTTVLTAKERSQAYELIRREVAQGRQTYVVLPLVEESEKLDLRSAIEEHDRLQQVFPDFQLGLLHGRMSSAEKDAAIEAFRANTTQILVSTTVIEVGVDVPNASVMLIEHAERFGLSQLHQLRGRVGRGADKSFCLLMTKPKASDDAQQRLKVMEESQDGFYLAEMDMQLRGPGEVLGTRQSGLPDFALASLVDDREALILARSMAEQTIAADPDLSQSPLLAQEVEARFLALMGGSMLT